MRHQRAGDQAVKKKKAASIGPKQPKPRTQAEIRTDRIVVSVQRYLQHPRVSRKPEDVQWLSVDEWAALPAADRENWDTWWLQEQVDQLLLRLLRGESLRIMRGKDGHPSKLTAEMIGRILAAHAQGAGFEKIARQLADDGIRGLKGEDISAKDVERVVKRGHSFDAVGLMTVLRVVTKRRQAPGQG